MDTTKKIVTFVTNSSQEIEVKNYAQQMGFETLYVFRNNGEAMSKSFLTMLEFILHYDVCQGLLVYQIKDICYREPSVVSWIADKIAKANKCLYSVVPYNLETLPKWDNIIDSDLNTKWQDLISSHKFQFKWYPLRITICIFEKRCFYKCKFCFQIKNSTNIVEQSMERNLFEKIINELPPEIPMKIILTPGGEPLLYPQIHKMVKHIDTVRPQYLTEYATNGILMNKLNAEKIIESGLKEIMISLNAPTREDYQWFHGRDTYNKVVANILSLMELRSKSGSATPIVRTKIMGLKRWAEKIDEFVEYWNEKVDQALVVPVFYYQDEEFENIEALKPPPSPIIPTCHFLSSNMIIMPNGRYQPCCAPDFKGEKYGPINLGNATDKNPIDVWNSEQYMELRKINVRGLPILDNCFTCGVNLIDFETDLIRKRKYRNLLCVD